MDNYGVDHGLLLGMQPRFTVCQIYDRMYEGHFFGTHKVIAVDSQYVVTNNGYVERPIPKLTFEQMANTGEMVRRRDKENEQK